MKSVCRWIAVASYMLLAACETLPSTGPSANTISTQAVTSGVPTDQYLIVDLDEPTVRLIGPWRPRTFADRFAVRSGPRSQPIGVGDVLAIQVLEAGDNGLFANTETRGAAFTQQVDSAGNIYVPFVGRTRAAGRTVEALRASLQKSLEDKAIQPQVLVTVTTNLANATVVVGDAVKPGRYSLNVGGTRLLDAVALAGGSRYATYETTVTLKRGRETGTLLLEDLFVVPANNVFLRPDDEILLTYSPQTFTLLGAVTAQNQIKFETKTVTLAEAIGKGSGLADALADASGVFVFRFEEASLVGRIRPGWPVTGAVVPTIYRINLKDPNGLFVARSLWLRDKDMVYVATAPSVEFTRFLTLVNSTVSIANTGASLVRNVKLLQSN